MRRIGKFSLTLIILIVLSLRLYLAFSSQYFNDDSSYYILRQVQHIQETKVPLYNDELSYSGRVYVFSPIYHYILAFFTIFFPLEVAVKIIPNLIAALMIPIVFLLTRTITKNDYISLFTAIASIFIPIFVKNTYNSLNSITLSIFLSFLMLYHFLNLKEPKSVVWFLVIVVVLSLLTPLSVVIVLGLLIYLVLSKLVGIKNLEEEREVILFSTFFSMWIQFLLYKKAFLLHSFKVIWQNIPETLLNDYFTQFSIPQAIYLIGFMIFLSGIYVIYNNILSEKDRKINVFFGIAIAIIVLLWFKLIEFDEGLMILGFIFIILFGYFLSTMFKFMQQIHLQKYNLFLGFIITLLFIFGSVIPTVIEVYISYNSFQYQDDYELFNWIKYNTPENSVILVPVDEAHAFTYFSGRKNVMDSNFLLVQDIEERKALIDESYTTSFKNNAVRNLNKYEINYIALTQYAKKFYNIDKLLYIDDNCFLKVYEKNNVSMYQSLCTIE